MIQPPAIEVEQLTKIYKGSISPAVDHLDFQVSNGEFFGLLGPNGAGKTSTLSMLCGLIQPSSGSMNVLGYTHRDHNEKIKTLIGVVPQDIALFPTLTAYENLRYFGNMYGLNGKSLKEKISGYLDKFGLSMVANKQVGTFSGGMKRRINLIAAILHNPKILFLDEPTVGVDVHSRAMIGDFLKSLNNTGITIIYTSHLMDEAQQLCNRIGIMDYGKIIAEGTPKQLIHDYQCANLEDLFLKLTGRNLRD